MAVTDELRHVRMDQTEEILLKKLDKIIHEVEEYGCLTSKELDDIKDIWEAMKHMKTVRTMEGR